MSAVVRAKARDSALADKQVRDRARMDPVARNLLFINLIFLAAGQMLYTHGMLPDWASGVVNILGIILLIAALARQFGGKKRDDKLRHK